MDQADLRSTAARAALEAHSALSDENKYKLHRVCRAIEGLERMIICDEAEQGRAELTMLAREDLAAIFEIFRVQIEEATDNLPYVSRTQTVAIVAQGKGTH